MPIPAQRLASSVTIMCNRIMKRVNDSRFFSILFDETTDMSHTSQISLTVRYVHEGTMREDFLEFVDPHTEIYGDHKKADVGNDETSVDGTEAVCMSDTSALDAVATLPEPRLTGSLLGNLVIKSMEKIGLDKQYCVGIGTDGCSVMASKVCGAVSTIQNEAPQAIRCQCFSHALNLSFAKSSTIQNVRNTVSTVKHVVAFFSASGKRNFVLKRFAGQQLHSLCETRWVERHEAILLFCSELTKIVDALQTIC